MMVWQPQACGHFADSPIPFVPWCELHGLEKNGEAAPARNDREESSRLGKLLKQIRVCQFQDASGLFTRDALEMFEKLIEGIT